MVTLIAIGFVGGLITGISPCILPVLPVILLAGAQNPRSVPVAGAEGARSANAAIASPRAQAARPYLVIAGLVLSFSVVTLVGSALLSLLHLPHGTIRWLGLAALVAIGLGLIFPAVQTLLERPFSRLPMKQFGSGGGGFGLGLALGVLYVPCAGPVLAAIVLAGATGSVGVATIALTLSFAIGAAVPLLFFALAGRQVAERVQAFRRRQRQVRVFAGFITILLAVTLAFDLPALLQREIPDYSAAFERTLDGSDGIRRQLNLTDNQDAALSNCTDGAAELQNCGGAPDIAGITDWLNTPRGAAVDLESLRGKVVLVDFWAYSCINCQRSIPHVLGWYNAYHDKGFEVVGVHTPEYAFEHDKGNVATAAAELGITYPIALDNNYTTWTNYHNQYWPAHYLIDAHGVIRHIRFGEGDYDITEGLIRQLLSQSNSNLTLPAAVDEPDTTPTSELTPETYLGAQTAINYGGSGSYTVGTAVFDYPPQLFADTFALRGRWTLDRQFATADEDSDTIALNYHARNVYFVVGGAGTVTVTRDGTTTRIPINGPPNMRQIVSGDTYTAGRLDVGLSRGLQAYSFTYG